MQRATGLPRAANDLVAENQAPRRLMGGGRLLGVRADGGGGRKMLRTFAPGPRWVCNPELCVFFLKWGVADFSQIIAHGVPFDLNITRTAIESCRRAWTGDANRRWRGLLNLSEF